MICAGLGDDTIRAGLGNDVVLAHKGADRLWGSRGRDQLRGGAPGVGVKSIVMPDEFLPGPGRDSVYGRAKVSGETVDYSVENRGVQVETGGGRSSDDRLVNVDVVIGTRFDDRIRLGHGQATGLGGSDTLGGNATLVDFVRDEGPWPRGPRGKDGDDTLHSGDEGAKAYLLRGRDRFVGGVGKDRVSAGTGGDRIVGRGGWDRLSAIRSGRHRIRGTVRLGAGRLPGRRPTRFAGFESYSLPLAKGGRVIGTRRGERIVSLPLYTGPNSGAIFGRGGNDRLESYAADLHGGRGSDSLTASFGQARAYGGPGRDSVYGQRVSVGGRGADRVSGRTVIGGPGDDELKPSTDVRRSKAAIARGGSGSDLVRIENEYASRFRLAGGRGRDRILFDFVPWTWAERLKVDLRRQRFSYFAPNQNSAHWKSRTRGMESVVVTKRVDSVLKGDAQDNRLIGGKGKDRIDGRGGTDTCRGERVRRCEKRG